MKSLFFLLLLLFASAGSAIAQWITNGPYGGVIYCSQRIGNDLYIGTDVGIFRSSDGGRTWAFHHEVVSGSTAVFRLFFDGTVLYASKTTNSSGGMHISADTGRTWTHITSVITAQAPVDIVSVNGKVFARNSDGTYVTANHGQTWEELALPPGLRDELFACGNTLFKNDDEDLYRSTDDGQNWSLANQGMNDQIQYMFKMENTLYAFSYTEVYTSSDDGLSWEATTSGSPPLSVSGALAFNGERFFASMGGNTNVKVASIAPGETEWTLIEGLPDNITWHIFTYGTDVFMTRGIELYGSFDNGGNWELINSGITAVPVYSAARSGADMLCGSEGKIYYSPGNSGSWTNASFPDRVYRISDLYRFGSTLFAAADGYGVYSSADNGQTWGNRKLQNQYLYRFADDGTNLFVGSNNAVFRSSDGGATWLNFSTGLPAESGVTDLEVYNGFIFACVAASGFQMEAGLYRSPLGNAGWTRITEDLTHGLSSIAAVGPTLYVGIDGAGVYKSTDQGASWTADNTGIEERGVYDLLAAGPDLIAATDEGVWVRYAGSSAWTDISYDLPPGTVYSLARNNDYLFAATERSSLRQIPFGLVGIRDARPGAPAFRIDPNPAGNLVQLSPGQQTAKTYRLTIYDMTGRNMFNRIVEQSRAVLDVSGWSNGVYFVQLHSDKTGGSAVQKLVVQH